MDPVATTSATYDRIASAYDERITATWPELAALRQAFCDAVSGPAADLGCGPGRDLEAIRAKGIRAVGVDRSDGMLERARRRGLPVVRGDLRRPPLRPGALAGIWSAAALLHVPRPEVATTLRTWHALLRPGGQLSLMTSVAGEDGWEVVPYATGPDGSELRRWFVHHDETQLLDALSEAGFTVTSCTRRESHRVWSLIEATA
jgi:SAM-dependent methyltransferase